MDDFMDAYVRKLKNRIARLEMYPCRNCRDLAARVDELEEEIKRLRLETHINNLKEVIQ